MTRQLLIGCGFKRDKRICAPGDLGTNWSHLVTIDDNPECKPDICADLNSPSLWPSGPDPQSCIGRLQHNLFDEIHAYEVLEHLGEQGNVHKFFWDFRNLWRVLKPGGYLCATVPHFGSLWAWGDPSHTRIINAGSLVFLDRDEYNTQLGRTSMSSFRKLLDFDFERVNVLQAGDSLHFVLRALKPPRVYLPIPGFE